MEYSILIDELQQLPIKEKIQIRNLLNHYVVEEKREEYFRNYKNALKKAEKGELTFSSETKDLLKMLE